ncbi:N-alpha-acetyltransferase 30 [Paramormyrops kingsleyae]|uniref:N-alpha-acetyltransferase 30 n=1 Tax=Paramormyrops kingsleyae TaxID=1676925 RepID=A0A3B3R7I1_9TELE|nr:N-alpha-acetyltransferase 30 [Paramormyrops kingsleyae]
MAEVPPGPSALPASPAEIIPFPGGVCTVPGGGDERDCGRGEPVKTETGQLQQACEGKGTNKSNQKCLCSHPSAHFHTQAPQQLNGLIGTAEDGLLSSQHRSRVQSHLHHPVHRPPDGQRGQSEYSDSAGEARGGAQENCHADSNHGTCPQRSRSSSDNGICGVPAAARTERSPGSPAVEEPGSARCPEDGELSSPVREMAGLCLNSTPEGKQEDPAIEYVRYESELQMADIMRLITKDLSEPYSIYTYRYFIHNWPQLCFLAVVQQECVGAIVCKLDMHKKVFRRGYIAMLAVDSKYRRKGIGTNLVKKAIYAMVDGDCDEVVLETEITNKSALKLYENLGFVRDKRLFRYYLNGVDALRLKLWLR